jgi:hypothetical protein
MLEKLIEVLENNVVRVRTKTSVVQDGQEVSANFSFEAIEPGDDYSSQDDQVKTICAALHTPAAIAAFKA